MFARRGSGGNLRVSWRAVLPIYDALYASDIKHVLVRHEQGAAHAADGYARATGKVGVCLATSGPGATNLVTGIATAYMDSIPMVAFTGQVPTPLIGRDAFQEADITGITLPITKHNYLVQHSRDLARVVKEAFHLARTNRPGPVVVDLPRDIMAREVDPSEQQAEIGLKGYRVVRNCNMGQVLLAVNAIEKAERPVIYAGGGVIGSDASETLQELALKRDIPVTTTLMGVGCFPETHHLSLGMLGMHGTRYANYAVSESDLLIAVGVRFDDRVTGKISSFAPHARVIHIDIDAAEIGKNYGVDIPIVGNVKQVLEEIVIRLQPREGRCEWHHTIDRWKEQFPLVYPESYEDGRIPQFVVEQIYQVTGKLLLPLRWDRIRCGAQFYKYTRPRRFITSGGLGTIG